MTKNFPQTTWNGPTATARAALETMLYGLMLVGLVTALAVAAQAEDSPLGRGVRLQHDLPLSANQPDGLPAGGDRPHYYGILGPVGQAGVYSSDDPRLTLSELVASAGGLTDDAAPLAKVIRHGRGGLQLIYSPTSNDPLMSGDVVVFDRVVAAQGPPGGAGPFTQPVPMADGYVGVAFVGVEPLHPIVISLPVSLASVSQVINDLKQPPALINSVQLIRTSPTAPRTADGRLPAMLMDGDVVVFQPTSIDRTALATAVPFPPAIPIARSQYQATPAHPMPTRSALEFPGLPPTPVDDLSCGPVLAGLPPAATEPARSFEPHALPPLSFAEPSEATPYSRSGDEAGSRAASAPTGASAPTADFPAAPSQPAAPRFVVPTGLVDRTTDPTTHSAEPSVIAAENVAADSSGFAASSFDRLAMGEPSGRGSSFGSGAAATFNGGTSRSKPVDPPATTSKHSAERSTTWGIIVVMIAVICFAASLLWSRFDEATGVASDEHVALGMPLTNESDSPQRHPLDRLIDNSLPIIEEPASVSDRLDYHGEAVGRRRIRIDARHDLTGPHRVKTPRPTPESVSVADLAPRVEPSIRIDDPVAEAKADREAATTHTARPAARGTSTTPTSSSNGGLLERVLVAMEREKRP